MENGSKALIIAGAILITLMVIALGVTIYKNATETFDTDQLSYTEITMFNSKFEKFADNQMGSQVKSLITFAISNAGTNKDDPVKLPKIVLKGIADGDSTEYSATGTDTNYINDLSEIRSVIKSTHTYKVLIGYNNNTGMVNQININW